MAPTDMVAQLERHRETLPEGVARDAVETLLETLRRGVVDEDSLAALATYRRLIEIARTMMN